MVKEIPYNFGDTGINGEVLGRQNVYSLPLGNSVLTSDPLTITINKTPNSASSRYFLPYENPELGSNTDKTGVYRNEILQINNQRQYRYLIQDGTGSNYPVDTTYDLNYNSTKVISNFDNLSNSFLFQNSPKLAPHTSCLGLSTPR